jgi:hypothetical protein
VSLAQRELPGTSGAADYFTGLRAGQGLLIRGSELVIVD